MVTGGGTAGGGGGGGEKFSRHTITQWHVFDQIFFKNIKFPNKKGTFDVNLVFTATLACTIDILYTLDSASNYSDIQKLKP